MTVTHFPLLGNNCSSALVAALFVRATVASSLLCSMPMVVSGLITGGSYPIVSLVQIERWNNNERGQLEDKTDAKLAGKSANLERGAPQRCLRSCAGAVVHVERKEQTKSARESQ